MHDASHPRHRFPPLELASCGLVALALAGVDGAAAEGGDTPGTATPLTSFPVVVTGDTTPFAHDFDVVCPFPDSTSPDVFYGFSTDRPGYFEAWLCDSWYDTKVYVLDANTLEVMGCNDDGCSGPGGGLFRSNLIIDELPIGDYVMGIDGYLGDAGFYEAFVTAEGARCFGDLDASGAIEFGDLLVPLTFWGVNCTWPVCWDEGDLDRDGDVDFEDVLVVIARWGTCAP